MVVVSALALALGLAAQPQRAQAQYLLEEPRVEPRAALSVDAQLELAHVESLASAATAVYVTSVVLHVVGLGVAVGTGLATFCLSFGGSCPDRSGADAAIVSGLIGSGVGLAGIFVGLGFDGASGRGRNRLRREHPSFDFSAAPTQGGAALSLLGRF